MGSLTEREMFDRIAAILQTYRSADGRSLYRTAIVWEQRGAGLEIRGCTDPVLVWLVDADSATGNEVEVRGYPSVGDARRDATAWLGEEREVGFDRLAGSAVVVMMCDLTGTAWS